MLTPSDLTRLEAIRDWAENGTMDPRRREELRWLLARLAPATPSDAATAGDAREADMREALQRIRTITDDPEVDDGDETEILWKAIAAIHQIADDALIVAPASAERSGAAPEGPATPAGAPNPTCAHCGPERACADHAAPPAAGSREDA